MNEALNQSNVRIQASCPGLYMHFKCLALPYPSPPLRTFANTLAFIPPLVAIGNIPGFRPILVQRRLNHLLTRYSPRHPALLGSGCSGPSILCLHIPHAKADSPIPRRTRRHDWNISQIKDYCGLKQLLTWASHVKPNSAISKVLLPIHACRILETQWEMICRYFRFHQFTPLPWPILQL